MDESQLTFPLYCLEKVLQLNNPPYDGDQAQCLLIPEKQLTFPTSLQNYSNKPIINSIQLLSPVQILATPWTEAHQASLSTTNSWSLLKRMSIESVMSPNHLILCCPFSSCLLSFPASGAFPMSWLFASGGQSTGVSVLASVPPMNIQD